MKAKFKVGDILKPLVDDTGLTKLHVIEVLTQLCCSGIEQVHYSCRVWIQQFKGSSPKAISTLIKFTEIEVERWCPPKENNK